MKRVQKGGFFGLFIGEKIVGYVNLNPYGDDQGHFQSIYISREHRGKGLSHAMMEHALAWYKERGVRKVHLYTEVDNKAAQSLYRKHNFTLDSRSWHFVVPFSTLEPKEKFTCQEVSESEIEVAGGFSERLPSGEIRRWHSSNDRRPLMLRDHEGVVAGVCMFTPGFPGCRPFEIRNSECFDDFILGIKARSLPEFDYVRVVFAGNDDLASLCKNRGYDLVDEMFYFTAEIGV